MATVCSTVVPLLFADDTSLFITGKNLSSIMNAMNHELINITEWLNVNKLSLNIKKTHYMVFNIAKKNVKTSVNINVNNFSLEKVNSTKFLGVIIDSKISWLSHIQFIKTKISKGIGILCKARKYLTISSLITLYFSFIYPNILYCIETWGGAYNTRCLLF